VIRNFNHSLISEKLANRFTLLYKSVKVPYDFIRIPEKEKWMLFFRDNFTGQFLEGHRTDVMSDARVEQNTDYYLIHPESLTRTGINFCPA